MDSYFEELTELVAIPSISSDPSKQEEVLRCSEFFRRKLESMEVDTEIVETEGYPIVVGDASNDSGSKTVALYGHYDVQPIASPDEWETDPFSLVEKEGKYFGRGASDDKGNFLTALKAAEVYLSESSNLNFQFIIEGEEESGSPNFENGLKKARQLLNPDLIIAADGGWISRESPSIEYGLRGLLYMHWNLETAKKNAHSGAVGGPARNPLLELFKAATDCIDVETGEIKIPGIYENVKEPSPEEVEHWTSSNLDVFQFKELYELTKLRFDDRTELMKSLWTKPTFEVHGCVGGYGEKDGKMTVLPSEGQLHVSMRLVPDQDTEEIYKKVKKFVNEINPDIEINDVSHVEPYLTDFSSSNIQAAVDALEETFDRSATRVRAGGSIGAVPTMDRVLNPSEVIKMGFSLPEHGIHGPNEYFSEEMASGGIRTYLNIFNSLAD